MSSWANEILLPSTICIKEIEFAENCGHRVKRSWRIGAGVHEKGCKFRERGQPKREGTRHMRKRSRGERHLLPYGRECTSLTLARFSELRSSSLPTMHYESTCLPFTMELPPTGADLNRCLFSCTCNTPFSQLNTALS